MNDIYRAVILGIVEGLTEFLPVSSTGHMILAMPLLGITPADPSFRFWNDVFIIFIQLGAILAVVIYFWRRLWRLTFKAGSTPWHENILVKLLVAFLPAAVIGKLAHEFIEARLMNPFVVACALVLGGIGILVIEKTVKRQAFTDAGAIPLTRALGVGFAQCLAMIPGTSRSAATIMGALVLGMTPPAAAEFSFFLAIPTMFAASLYSLKKNLDQVSADRIAPLAIGFGVSFIVAWVVVAAFIRFIQTHKFTSFAIYRIVIGAAVLACALSHWRNLF
jgi:undecaprenyl-diphosphatase